MHTTIALVAFSGGQDSTACLVWALKRFARVHTIGFDYGQRHRIELACRLDVLHGLRELNPVWNERLASDTVIELGLFKSLGGNALTGDGEPQGNPDGLPNTFVPGRNLLFLTAAAAKAYHLGAKQIVLGVCETDYSGYPDCRDDTIKAMQVALNLGMETKFALHTPLMWLTKAQTWAMLEEQGGDSLLRLAIERTHTCYNGVRETLHPWGYGCGRCPACQLRAAGFEQFMAARAEE